MNNSNDYIKTELERLDQQIAENQSILVDPGMAELARQEISKLQATKQILIDSSNQNHASTKSANDTPPGASPNIAILELRPAAGGEEAKIWSDDLLRMYTRYANTQNWQVSELEDNVIKIKGPQAYQLLQYEAGVHRVQRVPVTEAQGRIHTSTATVAVLPEIKTTEVNIDDKDIEFTPFKRSSGAGGQNVNKVATAVRITHIPTGITIEASRERSQIQNREAAMKILAAKLWQLEEERRLEELGDARAAIGRGMRSEKIRTYNYPQNRVTDHRLNKSWKNLNTIIDGDLNKIINELDKIMPATSM